MKLGSHYLRRYKDIALLLLRHGEAGVPSRFGGETGAGSSANGIEPEDLPRELERLGPTFVKLGQLLSSRADLLPDRYLKSLSRLQDKVKPFSFSEVEEVVEKELGTRINKAFDFFDPEPLAAASLGQVHCALLHDGRPVAVKVQRPGIERQIDLDFAALEEIARFLSRHTQAGRRYQFPQVLSEFEHTLAHELDYRREAANMITLATNLARFPNIQIPLPVQDYTTRRILTMEYVDGTKITELSPVARLDFDGNPLAEELFHAYLRQILVDGIFHADPHPGNILLTDDYRIVLLDLGMVGHTTPAMQENLLKLLLAVSEGQSEQAADIAVSMSQVRANFNAAEFRQKIGRLVAEQQNSTLDQIDVGRVVLDVNRNAAETGLFPPAELSMLGKTLLQLDEVGRFLARDFDPNASVRRNAREILNERLKMEFSQARMVSNILEAKQFVAALPSRLNRILDAVGKAELNVMVKPAETEFLLQSAQKVANRITTGVVLASLIVGAALLMQVDTQFKVLGYPGFAMICFLAAALGGFGLVISIFLGDHKTTRQSRRR